MQMCLCPTCKQTIEATSRSCEFCSTDFSELETGRSRSAFIVFVLIATPVAISLYSRIEPYMTKFSREQQVSMKYRATPAPVQFRDQSKGSIRYAKPQHREPNAIAWNVVH